MSSDHQKRHSIPVAFFIFDALLVLSIIIMIVAISFATVKIPGEEIDTSTQIAKTVPQDPFKDLSLQAKAVYVFDISKNKALFKKNELEQLPLASLTKLMMALTAVDLVPPDSNIVIKKEFLEEEGDSGLFVNENWKLRNLLDFSLMVSSNDGARSVASVVGALDLNSDNYDLGRKDFISKMNDEAQKLGLKQMYFINESGLDEGSVSGGYGSVIDVEKLIQYLLKSKPEILETTKYESMDFSSLEKVHTAVNTDTVINQIPGLLASKTGYTDLAGGNLAVAFDASIGHPIVVVVLGSTEQGRFDDVSKLVKASLEYIGE